MREAEDAQFRQYIEQQKQFCNQIVRLTRNSVDCFQKMPNCLQRAEHFLDQAKKDFSEGVFPAFLGLY